MLDLYPQFMHALAAEQALCGLPLVAWLGDGAPASGHKRVIAANLAHTFGGVLVIDKNAA